ncbi:Ras GTPase exchange factor [Acrasis kona]|uniref:Ras GTPase exchange factor n=1 Tax=Acrasis kona TaxID=1008807 RepID=A0AAW2Z1P1_9EUKA
MSTHADDLGSIPQDAIGYILSYLNLSEVAACSSICQIWRSGGKQSLHTQYGHDLELKNLGVYPLENCSLEMEDDMNKYKDMLDNHNTTFFVNLGTEIMKAGRNNQYYNILNRQSEDEPSAFFYTYQSQSSKHLIYLLMLLITQAKNEALLALLHVLQGFIEHLMEQSILYQVQDYKDDMKLIQHALCFTDNLTETLDDDTSFAVYLINIKIKMNLIRRASGTLQWKARMVFPIDPQQHVSYKNISSIPPHELAKQLTIQRCLILDAIKPHEYCGYPWRHSQEKCPNIMKSVRSFENVSSWIATAIVTPPTAQERAAMLEYFIQLCYHLLEVRNFDFVFCVMGALTSASVYRLKSTFELISEEHDKMLKKYQDLVSLRSDFIQTRVLLQTCDHMTCLPFHGLFLGDLKAVHDSIMKPTHYFGSHTSKMEYKLISRLQRYRFEQGYFPSSDCVHDPEEFFIIPAIQELLEKELATAVPVQQLYQVSLLREPRI